MGMMHNVTARLNSAFFFGVWLLAALAALNIASSFFIEQKFDVKTVSVTNLKLYKNTRYNWDEADMEFTLNADLTDIFNWNVKLIYLYLELDYYNPERNQVIVWDKIIWRDQLKQIKVELTKNKGKYLIKTKSYDLLGRNATATLKWEVIPITGFVYKMQSESVPMQFLEKYSY